MHEGVLVGDDRAQQIPLRIGAPVRLIAELRRERLQQRLAAASCGRRSWHRFANRMGTVAPLVRHHEVVVVAAGCERPGGPRDGACRRRAVHLRDDRHVREGSSGPCRLRAQRSIGLECVLPVAALDRDGERLRVRRVKRPERLLPGPLGVVPVELAVLPMMRDVRVSRIASGLECQRPLVAGDARGERRGDQGGALPDAITNPIGNSETTGVAAPAENDSPQ